MIYPKANNLLGYVNQGGGSKLGEGVQGDNDHRCGGVRGDQVLQKFSTAGCQTGVMVHVLHHGDQLQFQVHGGLQT